ncbi:protein ABSCISIC ACID-INSENSITIVE 5 isoform X2 [Carica papaya]|uniref:protein ABSCISIC ACID-INSENSITIVE 5 isoform X2 n=1 Tax=Carica papaya TaxID=3649 RepID=UPI000B8CF4D6|nr:protein ABSCISIC ACID-INSENSITIVE 5 isoform X2 [Carica papaya]
MELKKEKNMVLTESKMAVHGDLRESPPHGDPYQKNGSLPFSCLGRQSSIYSLTLDEFQHALCESGKNFGSMNMEEFLTSIWNAEENQAVCTGTNTTISIPSNLNNDENQLASLDVPLGADAGAGRSGGAGKQPSLARQGSLTIPAPLCRKTVEEVWSEIHKGQRGEGGGRDGNESGGSNLQTLSSASQQPTFGEMTLEDFLIKAGVVREQCAVVPPSLAPQQQHFGVYQNTNNANVAPSYVPRHIMTMGGNNNSGGGPSGSSGVYPPMHTAGGGVIGEPTGYANNGKMNGGYPQAPSRPTSAVCYGGRVANGGGYAPVQPIAVVPPMSPVAPSDMCTSQVDCAGNQYGMDMSVVLRGRKRIIDGPVEKVVERRQRRMIKNRESAARSRARKQAYTVELEAELNQLKEENTHLKHTLAELETRRKQQYFEEIKTNAQTKAERAREKLRLLRRTVSWP